MPPGRTVVRPGTVNPVCWSVARGPTALNTAPVVAPSTVNQSNAAASAGSQRIRLRKRRHHKCCLKRRAETASRKVPQGEALERFHAEQICLLDARSEDGRQHQRPKIDYGNKRTTKETGQHLDMNMVDNSSSTKGAPERDQQLKMDVMDESCSWNESVCVPIHPTLFPGFALCVNMSSSASGTGTPSVCLTLPLPLSSSASVSLPLGTMPDSTSVSELVAGSSFEVTLGKSKSKTVVPLRVPDQGLLTLLQSLPGASHLPHFHFHCMEQLPSFALSIQL